MMKKLEASVVGEIVPGNQFYDYEDKYLQDEADLQNARRACRKRWPRR